ncbi:lipoprotein [Acerihabitans sp. TG2]|uniref:LPS translocon maturation chaperone LptM n=1 Tax=Acerihabitans sp. TG2 TaxID=3096008 RepID=UPI002B221ED3|nr:lipoprotein [Acerihabitans sp. TG2]MEA9390960.1 lipoprotein [Acerihabitans sp. TG2]
MKKPLRLIMLAFLVLGLNGCGLKGPLYFPPAEKPVQKPKLTQTGTATQSPVQTANPSASSQTTPTKVLP